MACFEGSQSGSSSIGMLGPRMECPGSPSAAREMTGSSAFAVKREHLLAPVVGRRFLGGDVGRPVAHHLTCLVTRRWTGSLLPLLVQVVAIHYWCTRAKMFKFTTARLKFRLRPMMIKSQF